MSDRDYTIADIPKMLNVDLDGEPSTEEVLEVLQSALASEEEFIVRSLQPEVAKDIRVYKYLIKRLRTT